VTQTETRIFHYDLRGHLIAETNQTGQMLAEYVYLGDQLLSMIKPGETVYYFHNDHLGTPQVLTDDSQAIAWKAVYTPFGGAVPSISTVENPFRFPGQYYDQETGLHYNYFRYYNPQTGRYINPDPIGLEGGINLFLYAESNPLRWIDLWGLYGWLVHYHKTELWAIEVGIDPATARIIAKANQSADELVFQQPHSPLAWLVGGLDLHFPRPAIIDQELMKYSKLGLAESFGRTLHSLQDSYSHQGIGPLTHARRGYAPDKYCENSPRDQEMESVTKWWLREFKRSMESRRNRPFK
jgi:RHS repeat-associated protein